METLDIVELKKSIDKFNKEKLCLTKASEAVRIDTPFYNRHNDSLILYVIKKTNGNLLITDDGYVIDDLQSSGINILKSKKRKNLLKEKLNSFSVKINEDTNELYIESSMNDFPINQNLLLQAMMFVDDMFMLSKPRINKLFIEDVETFFDDNDIRAVTGPSLIDKNGMSHRYDFIIPGSNKKNIPEKLIKTLNTPSNEAYAKSLTMDVLQTRDLISTSKKTEFYAIINDSERDIEPSILNLFNEKHIVPIPYSKRNLYIQYLTA